MVVLQVAVAKVPGATGTTINGTIMTAATMAPKEAASPMAPREAVLAVAKARTKVRRMPRMPKMPPVCSGSPRTTKVNYTVGRGTAGSAAVVKVAPGFIGAATRSGRTGKDVIRTMRHATMLD